MCKVVNPCLAQIKNMMNNGVTVKAETQVAMLPTMLTCPIGGAPIGGIIPGGIIPGGMGVMLGGRCPIGGIPMGGK